MRIPIHQAVCSPRPSKRPGRRGLFFAAAMLCLIVPVRAQSFDPGSSPFAGKSSESYSSYKGEDGRQVDPLWGSLKPDDFGSRKVTFDPSGIRSLAQVPAPGIHPRIVFTPGDLPEIRKRLKETQAGRQAWRNILCWTKMMKGEYDDQADYAKPDKINGGFGGLHGPVPLYRLGVDRVKDAAYNKNPNALAFWQDLISGKAKNFPQFYWDVFSLEAFRCLVEDDRSGAETLAKAVSTALKLDQEWRENNRKEKKITRAYAEPLRDDNTHRGFQFAFCYDFLFNWLTEEQRQTWRRELAETTWSHDNYGTFNNAEASRSNWATFSYWLFEVLAIEGESGFNDLKVRGMYRGWRNLLTYGWFQSGATFEGEAKNQLGMDGVIMFAMREKSWGFQNLAAHPYLRSYATQFLPQSVNPMQTGFHKYDLLGSSRARAAGFSTNDAVGLKHMFPGDKVIDWVYRKGVGENYENIPDRPDGYYNALLFFAIFADDFDPANDDPAKLGLDLTFFCPERALMITRSSWDKDALQLNLHTRQANGGHAFADRNAIMVAGAGRIWSPNTYASFKTMENSVVVINGQSQTLTTPGRLVDYQSSPLADFAVGDASYCWNWNWKELDRKQGLYTLEDTLKGRVEIPEGWETEKHTINDFSFLKLPYSYLNTPKFEAPHWLQPSGAIRPVVRQAALPVKKAFRTAGIVRGNYPYALVVDDIQKDESVQHYDWTLILEYDVQIAKVERRDDHSMDIYLTGEDPDQTRARPKEALDPRVAEGISIPACRPMLLVRVLNRNTDPGKPSDPYIDELPNQTNAKKYQPVRRLIVPADSISPDFKVLLYPYRLGAPLPESVWMDGGKSLELKWNGQSDRISFTSAKSGKTDISIVRGQQQVISVNKEVLPFN